MRLYDEGSLRSDPNFNFGRSYQQCSISVMDTIADPNITFDEKGVCNYYYEYQKHESESVLSGPLGEGKLQELVKKIKESAKNKKYDCITGVSGGVDSSYLVLKAKQLGLRPLVVHFDNGWNSAIAVNNIERIIQKLDLDLYTLVVDWNEFKDLQLAYLKASVVDIEAITDHAIISTLYKLASKYNIKYILSGNNTVTEATLPKDWIWAKTDHRNIKDIHNKFGSIPIESFPLFTTMEKKYYSIVKGIEIVYPLNLLQYNKNKVKKIISDELGWIDYGGKHHESVFTRFYQCYILPVKFGIDKRKAHLSNLIFSNQISREEALEELKKPIYEMEQLKSDYEFVLKKLSLSEQEFEQILTQKRVAHSEFDTEKSIWERYPALTPIRPVWRLLSK